MSAFDWYEYLLLAWELRGRPKPRRAGTEALDHTVIGRAYYAAFITARNFLRDNDSVAVPRFAAHDFVIQQFLLNQDSRRRTLGKQLRVLRDLRNAADYDDALADVPDLADLALKKAERVIRLLERL